MTVCRKSNGELKFYEKELTMDTRTGFEGRGNPRLQTLEEQRHCQRVHMLDLGAMRMIVGGHGEINVHAEMTPLF